MSRFCCGVTRPNTECASSSVGEAPASRSARSGRSGRRPDRRRPAGPAGAAIAPTVPRVVAGDDLHRHVLLGEVAQGVGGVRPRAVAEHDERGGPQARRAAPRRAAASSVRASRTTRLPVGGRRLGAARERRRRRRSPAAPRRARRAPTSRPARTTRALHFRADENGTRLAARPSPPAAPANALRDRRERGVRVRLGRPRARPARPRAAASASRTSTVLDDEPPLGERAGLVDAQHVDAREALDGRQLLHEHPVLRQADDADGEREAREQHEPLRHHRDRAGDRGRERRPHVVVVAAAG